MTIEMLAAKVFATRDALHARHWAVTGPGSYAAHTALGELYEALPGLIDEIVEAYQGTVARRIGDLPDVSKPKGDLMLVHLQGELDWIQTHRSKIAAGHTHIENLIDELQSAYAKACYKLRFLA